MSDFSSGVTFASLLLACTEVLVMQMVEGGTV